MVLDVFIKWKIQIPFPIKCLLKMRDKEHSFHLAPQVLQGSGWEGCALVQMQYKLLVLYVPGSNCCSIKGECERQGLV